MKHQNKTGRKRGEKLAQLRARFPVGSLFGVDDVILAGLARTANHARALVAMLIDKTEVAVVMRGLGRKAHSRPAIFRRVKEAA